MEVEIIVDPIVVDNERALQALLGQLAEARLVGVDTESNSLYRYRERVCLIQLSTQEADYVVDPLALDVRPLGELFASADVEKVFHAGEYDIMGLKRDYRFSFCNVFDTMVASCMLGIRYLGLAALLDRYLGVRIDKSLQRANWERRPLDERQLRYAARDSHYLLPLRDILGGELLKTGRWQEACRRFGELCGAKWSKRAFDPDGYVRLRGAQRLSSGEKRVLRELYLWRERTARDLNRPPFRIAGDDLLLRLALLQPRSLKALRLVASSRANQLLAHGEEVLAAMRTGRDGAGAARVGRRQGGIDANRDADSSHGSRP